MIGAWEQTEGTAHAARNFTVLPGGAALDMAMAYPEEAGVISVVRTAVLAEEFQLTDEIKLRQPECITYTFLCREQPSVQVGKIIFAHGEMTFDAALTAAVEEIPVTDERMQGSWPGMLWRLTLTSGAAVQHCQTFRVTGK